MAAHAMQVPDAGRLEASDFFGHPMLAGLAPHRALFEADRATSVHERLTRSFGASGLRFAKQNTSLLADGLHYEERIFRHGIVATREGNTHDLFNALIWIEHTALKRAMNARQAADIARVGPRQRTRGQCALTHFDEAGAIVWLSDPSLVPIWDAHDWPGLFAERAGVWGTRIAVTVIGHALFDFALAHGEMPVAKALVVRVDAQALAARSRDGAVSAWPSLERALARRIVAGSVLADPQELRPLPLAGLPGWDADGAAPEFFSKTPCFRPLRCGRRYPPPLLLADDLAAIDEP